MKFDNETGKKLLIGGMLIVFILIAASYLFASDNVTTFVNGDEVSGDGIAIGSVATTPDFYEFYTGETMDITVDVTNNQNQEFDFKVVIWEGPTAGSKETEIFESEQLTLEVGENFVFSTDYKVPLEPGIYYYSTISYYAPVGFSNFGQYDDGTNFAIEVISLGPGTPYDTPTTDDTPTGTPTATPTPDADETPTATPTETVDNGDGTEDGDEEDPYAFIDDENFKIAVGISVALLFVIFGYFAIRNKWLD